jgi:hypothetical protein
MTRQPLPDAEASALNSIQKIQSGCLKEIAGFDFVREPLPMRNANNAVVYYLFFASPKPVAERIIEEIFS